MGRADKLRLVNARPANLDCQVAPGTGRVGVSPGDSEHTLPGFRDLLFPLVSLVSTTSPRET